MNVGTSSRAVVRALRRPRVARCLSTAPAVHAAMATAPAPASPSPSQFQSQSRPQFKRGTIARRSAPKSSVPATSSGEAQSFFINLLGLPNSAAFSPELSLQILTHKSYRYAHRVSDTLSSTSAEREQSQASHNSRLAFIGRRALAAYSAMFVHSVLGHTSSADQAEFRRNRDMESRLDALRDPLNIGQHVGSAWGLESVMRWDKIPNGAGNDYAKVKAQAVEATLGAVFTQYGSPAAQRMYHTLILPRQAKQLRDARLIDAAQAAHDSAAAIGIVAK